MSKPRKSPGGVRIPADVLDDLNAGTRPTANLAEGLAVDFVALMAAAVPDVPEEAHRRLAVHHPADADRRRAVVGTRRARRARRAGRSPLGHGPRLGGVHGRAG